MNDIFKQTLNLTDRIWKYLQTGRKGKEANRLEREALSDPFLLEALEGLTSQEVNHSRIVAGLTRRLRQGPERPLRQIIGYWWTAASFLLLAAVALWLLRKPAVVEDVRLAAVPVAVDSVVVPPLVAKSVQEQEKERAGEAVPTDDDTEDQTLVVQVESRQSRSVLGAAVMRPPQGWRSVGGVVVDSLGSPLSGGGIMAGKSGVATDRNGRFQLKVEDSVQQLITSFVGMKSKHIPLSEQKELRIKLTEDRRMLDEVAVSGYAHRKTGVYTATTVLVADTGWIHQFNRYVADSLRYPVDAIQRKTEGEVVLSLRFNRRGRLGRIKVIQKLSPTCDREAIRLVEQYPGWWRMKKEDFVVRIPFKLR